MSGRRQPWVWALTAAVSQPEERSALAGAARSALPETVVLATCRRTEVIGFGEPPSRHALAAADYLAWLTGRDSVATLRRLRDRADARRRRELDRLFRRLPGLAERERELIGHLSVQLVASVLHEPSVSLRSDADGRRARAALALFGLEGES